MFEGVCVGELCIITKECILLAWVETHHVILLCIDSETLSLCVCSSFVQHCLHVVRVDGHEGKVISKQHVGRQKLKSASEHAFHPVCHAVNVVQVDGKQQRGKRTSLSNTKRWLHRSCLISIQRVFMSMMQVF